MSRPSTKGSSSLRAFGPLSAIGRPLLGGRGEPDLEVGPLGLQVVLHHVEDARGAAGGGGDVEAVGGEPADDAVVADEAVLAEQEAVAAAADPELRPGVGVHPLHEGDGVGADDLDLAERRGVEDAERGAGRRGTRGRRRRACPRPALREVPGAAPEGDRLEDGAVGLGPGVDRGLAGDLEGRVLVVAGEGAEGRRRVGRAEGGEADLRRRLAERVGGDHQAVDVRHLALVGRHAVGGVALDVLDRAHALADREADVLGGDVVLEVDEGLGRRRVAVGRQLLERDARAGAVGGRRRGPAASASRPASRGGLRRRRRRRRSSAAAMPQRPRPAPAMCTASVFLPGRKALSASSQARLPLVWEKRCRQGVQPPHISTASQAMSRAAPALPFSIAVDAERLHPQPAGGAGDGAAEQGLDAEGAGAVGQRRVDASARTSTMAAGFAPPASARSKAACQALSWAVTIAGRSPTLTP